MSDNKDLYSKTSKYYVENKTATSSIDQERYDRSKLREAQYNHDWSKQKVNINDIIDHFTPDFSSYEQGVKYVFEGERYTIKADMAAGYLRILDNATQKYVKLDGSPGSNKDTHFKIKKREEM